MPSRTVRPPKAIVMPRAASLDIVVLSARLLPQAPRG
jgi:hypothetical protein